MNKNKKNIIIYVGKIYQDVIDSVKNYAKKHNKKYRLALLYDNHLELTKIQKEIIKKISISIPCDLSSPISIQKALQPYQKQILSITARGEDNLTLLSKIIPHTPYVKTPTAESINWSTNKLMMRRKLYNYNKKITPKYTIVNDTSKKSIRSIETRVGFPLVAKPTGLAASKLVSICYHREELEKVLKKIFRKINSINNKDRHKKHSILVEEFMEGPMYSIDCYINSHGKLYFCPVVQIKTGQMIGFDDFFGYQQMTPSTLKKSSVKKARQATEDAVHALGLRSTTVHVELMKTEKGWKIIELSPRMGGFRHTMYKLTYNIDHNMNDILIHIPYKPIIPKRRKGYAAAMKFFAKKEGKLIKLHGIKKIKMLKSFYKIKKFKKIGDRCTYAKNGGTSIFNLILFNKDRSKLLADIRRVEQTIKIETKRGSR